MTDLQKTVAQALQHANQEFYDQPDGTLMMVGPEGYYRASADAAIRTTVEWLAAEAERDALTLVRRIPIPGTYLVEEGVDLEIWLTSHLPASDPESNDANT